MNVNARGSMERKRREKEKGNESGELFVGEGRGEERWLRVRNCGRVFFVRFSSVLLSFICICVCVRPIVWPVEQIQYPVSAPIVHIYPVRDVQVPVRALEPASLSNVFEYMFVCF